MYLHRTLSLLVASAALYQRCAAQEAMRPPSLISRNWSPLEAAALDKRAVCSDDTRCLIGQCCGTGCASNCCGHDQGGVGCGITERCSFQGNVFIGCCDMLAIGGCTGEATRITIHTPYATVTFGAETTTSALPSTTEQSFSLPTASAPTTRSTTSSTEQSFSLPTASQTGNDESPTASPSRTRTAMTDTNTTAASSTPAASSAVATTTSEGMAPMITAFIPREVNVGAVAVLGAWMVF